MGNDAPSSMLTLRSRLLSKQFPATQTWDCPSQFVLGHGVLSVSMSSTFAIPSFSVQSVSPAFRVITSVFNTSCSDDELPYVRPSLAVKLRNSVSMPTMRRYFLFGNQMIKFAQNTLDPTMARRPSGVK